MTHAMNQYQILSRLLLYPEPELIAHLPELDAALAAAQACPALYEACQAAYPKACSERLPPTS